MIKRNDQNDFVKDRKKVVFDEKFVEWKENRNMHGAVFGLIAENRKSLKEMSKSAINYTNICC